MNRIANPTTERSPFGLMAWLESTRVILPLKGIECSFNVCGEVINVEVDQIFEQNNSQPLDCLYSFPLPAGAAVYRCEMHVNGRLIRAKVEEVETARKIAQEKKAAGYRTALVEMERDNLFTLSLGNVQPGDVVVIRFAYFQTITHLGDWVSFRIPFCPGVRFIPGLPLLRAPKGRGTVDDTDQVPDASRISPPRIDALHPDAAYLAVSGTVEHRPGDIIDLSSPTHPVLVKPGEQASEVNIANQKAMPDSDFIVRWTEKGDTGVKASGWVTRRATETYALVRFLAPDVETVTEKYSQDVYFLIDRSGSMAGLKWQKAVEAFRGFLGVMGINDRVWASFFDDSVRDFSDKPEAPTVLASDRSFRNLEALGTGGGTLLQPALEHILRKIETHSVDRPHCLILITDGQVGNEAAILNNLAKHSALRVHVFGIDVTINDGFLQKLAAQHSGSTFLLFPKDDIVGAVTRLANRLRRPVLTSIQVSEPWEAASGELPDLHAGEILALPLKKRTTTEADKCNHVNLRANLPDGGSQEIRVELVEAKAEAVPLLWAKRRVDLLLAKGDTHGAIALAKANNLVCEGTAFIGWDDSEKVSVSTRELYQPAMDFDLLQAAGSGKVMAQPEMFGGVRHMPGHTWRFLLEDNLGASTAGDWDSYRHLANDPFLQGACGNAFLDTLRDWMISRPNAAGHTLKALRKLAEILADVVGEPAARRLKAVRKWVKKHVAEPYLSHALKCLDELEAELQLQGKLIK